jgi:hypothetical protein
VLDERYYLQPGEARSEHGLLPSVEHELHATLDGCRDATLRCRIDSSSEHTAVVEAGNGALSLTEGL